MPAPPTLLSGTVQTTATHGLTIHEGDYMLPRRKKGDSLEPRVVKTGQEAGRGGAATRPRYGQLWPRAVPGRNQ
jgi:hypothetical protein